MLQGCANANVHELGDWMRAFAWVEKSLFQEQGLFPKGFSPTYSIFLDNNDKISTHLSCDCPN
jgi:hypothetical protein